MTLPELFPLSSGVHSLTESDRSSYKDCGVRSSNSLTHLNPQLILRTLLGGSVFQRIIDPIVQADFAAQQTPEKSPLVFGPHKVTVRSCCKGSGIKHEYECIDSRLSVEFDCRIMA